MDGPLVVLQGSAWVGARRGGAWVVLVGVCAEFAIFAPSLSQFPT